MTVSIEHVILRLLGYAFQQDDPGYEKIILKRSVPV